MKKLCKFLCFFSRKKFDYIEISHNEINLNIIKGIQSNQSEKEFNLSQADSLSMKTEEDEEYSSLKGNIVFPEKYISDTEKKINFKFTDENILNYIEKQLNNNDDFEPLISKNGFDLYINKKGSIFNRNFPAIKQINKISKSEFPKGTTIQILDFYMNNPEARLQWDKSLKDYKIIEGDKSKYILYYICKSPMIFVSERDVIDKRYDFYSNNAFYDFSSSTNDNFLPEGKNIVRINDICSVFKMYEEGEDFKFISITQVDTKMNVPPAMYSITMPGKLKEWYDKLKKHINENFKGEVNEDNNVIKEENKFDETMLLNQ